MAPDDDFQISGRIEWKTELPNLPLRNHCNSPGFALHGSEWYLRFSCRTVLGGDCYKVSLMPRDQGRGQHTPFEVVTYMRDPKDASRAPFNRQWRRIAHRERYHVWEAGWTPGGIFVKLDWLRHKPNEVRFVCLFYGAEPSTVDAKTGHGTQCPSRTLDKGVQVSSVVPRDIESLSSDLSRLLEKEVLPDVRLECGGRTFRAHRSVLAARSDVFRAMFQNETSESQTGDVKVQEVDVGVLQELLKFLYSGRPEDISEDNASQLYEAADKYAVMSLKVACSYWMERHLAAENCVGYLVLADSHSDRDLKSAVVSFITGNPCVLKSEAWLALSAELPVLANEVLQAYVATTVQ